jgi:hypothetical protein
MKLMEQILLTAGILVFLGGCCSEPTVQHAEKVCMGAPRELVFQQALKTLENMRFTIEKADPEQGYISTRPLPAEQFFEFWKSDSVGCYNFEEGNLHSITRTVEITITGSDSGSCINCKATTRRLSIPQTPVTNTTEPYGLFTRSGSTPTLQLHKEMEKKAEWVDLGPDNMLESRILKRIEKRILDKMKG